ncbi:MAG: ATP synthase F1 subunit delta [Candidatus Eisenbacteria bacterium]|uniref:ATP synthase subunit delta n=1 Tax=Eiseniibacteriota bacterium TaxID=2212470 RepID=A0A538T3F2_UNCEI|nr:MAG: ATP synthase F1 subunit delta [Candidatus Eisenbacteria bacterium]
MISAVLARRYARALLALSQRLDDVERTHQDLRGVTSIFESDPRVRRFFEAPNIARTEKEAFLERRWKPKLNRNVYGLLVILLRRRRFDHLVAIAAEFHKLAEEAQGITRAIVRTAVPISERQADALTRALNRRTGRKVTLTREVDPALLGGVTLSLDHKVIDGTLATQLWRIRRQLREARV